MTGPGQVAPAVPPRGRCRRPAVTATLAGPCARCCSNDPDPPLDGPLVAVDRPDPSPGPGELRLRVTACAVCRTDLQLCEGDLAARTAADRARATRSSGVVDAVGDGRRRLGGRRPGRRRRGSPGTDGTCRFCRTGRENLCEAAAFTGWDRDGGYAEAVTARADVAVRLPDGFPDLAAAPLLCGGVIGYRSLRVAGSGRQSAGARLGPVRLRRLGPAGAPGGAGLGRGGVRGHALRGRAGAGARSSARRGPAATTTGRRSRSTRPSRSRRSGPSWRPPLRALDRGGVVAINAIHLDGLPAMPYEDLWWERSIRSVANVTRHDAREFLALAARIRIATDVETHPLADANVALARLAAGEVAGTAVLVVDPARRRR